MTVKRLGLVLVLGLLLPLSQASAASYWDGANYNNGTYDFNDGSKWINGFPGTGDAAYLATSSIGTFPDGAATTLQMSADTEVYTFGSSSGLNAGATVTLDLNGHTLTTTNGRATSPCSSIYSSSSSDHTGVTIISDSAATKGAANFRALTIGYDNIGRLRVDNATVNINPNREGSGTTYHNVGYHAAGANGYIEVVNGGMYNVYKDRVVLGAYAGASASVKVSGDGSSFNVLDNHIYGAYKTGTCSAVITVEDGGKITVPNGGLYLGINSGGAGATLLVDGANSLYEGAYFAVGGSVNSHSGVGYATISNGGYVHTTSAAYVWDESTLHMDKGTAYFEGHLRLEPGSTTSFVLYEAAAAAPITCNKSASYDLYLYEGALLDLSIGDGATLSVGDFVPLIEYAGDLAGVGAFLGYAEGSEITIDDYKFTITYVGGTNDKTVGLDVTQVPEPATLALLTCGGLALLRRRRQ